MTGNLLPLHNPKDTSLTHRHTHTHTHTHRSSRSGLAVRLNGKHFWIWLLCVNLLVCLGSQLLALSAMTSLWNSILLNTCTAGGTSSSTDTHLLYVDGSTSLRPAQLNKQTDSGAVAPCCVFSSDECLIVLLTEEKKKMQKGSSRELLTNNH